MENSRTKNASRNIVYGWILKVIQILIPFAMRTVIIYNLGIEYLGLNSLFTSILQVLNLAELGVGSAMVYSMYKPIIENDNSRLCALLNLYKLYYRVIGIVISIIGLCLLPFIPELIAGSIPSNINIYILYLLNLASTVLSYWMFAYKSSILQAYQRSDVISKVSIITFSIQYGLQFLVLYLYRNYYYYVIVMLITQALTNVITAIMADYLYPNCRAYGKVEKSEIKSINQHIRDLFTSKVGVIIYDSADTIIISAFLGLTALAIYNNYFYILNAISGMMLVFFNSCLAGIGNSILTESKTKNMIDLNRLTFIVFWITGFCSISLLCLYQPFMKVWVGEKLLLSNAAVVLFVFYFYIRQFNSLLNLYKDASGLWRKDRFRPLICAIVNLALNILMVQYIGIYGVLLSTVLAILIIGIPWIIWNLFDSIFDKEEVGRYVNKMIFYFFVTVLVAILTYLLCNAFTISSAYINIIVRLLICVVLPNILFIVIFHGTNEYQYCVNLIRKMFNPK